MKAALAMVALLAGSAGANTWQRALDKGTADGRQGAVIERPVNAPLPVARSRHREIDGEEDGAEAGSDRTHLSRTAVSG